jgi:hypothetical protein
MNQLIETRDKLKEIENGVEPSFKNSDSYIGRDWRNAEDCDTYPIQRKLTAHECVFDYDNISASQMLAITSWMKGNDFKFEAWLTGPDGIHIHFWTDITGLNRKKILTEVMSEKIKELTGTWTMDKVRDIFKVDDIENELFQMEVVPEEWIESISIKVSQSFAGRLFGVENDIGPMTNGMIRTEGAKHPRKGNQKILFMKNLSTLFPMNDINSSVRDKVSKLGLTSDANGMSNSGLSHGKCRTCMKLILDSTFTDCRKRLMFTVASHYVAVGLTKADAVDKTWTWAERQGGINKNEVWASVHSSSGKVGCFGRHKLLEEVGIDMEGKCKWE